MYLCKAPEFLTPAYEITAGSRIQVLDDAIVFDFASTVTQDIEFTMMVAGTDALKTNCGYTYHMSFSPSDKIILNNAGPKV